MKYLRVFILLLLTVTLSANIVLASFPGAYYPGNQYMHNARHYQGTWGHTGVYGAYGYFPNRNGYAPYGYRQYGHFYTPWDIHYGRAGW